MHESGLLCSWAVSSLWLHSSLHLRFREQMFACSIKSVIKTKRKLVCCWGGCRSLSYGLWCPPPKVLVVSLELLLATSASLLCRSSSGACCFAVSKHFILLCSHWGWPLQMMAFLLDGKSSETFRVLIPCLLSPRLKLSIWSSLLKLQVSLASGNGPCLVSLGQSLWLFLNVTHAFLS